MQVKVNMMRMLKVMSWHFSWLQITVINCCLQQPKRCETGSCDSCQAQRCLQLQPLLAMPPKKATTETKGNAKPKAKAPGRTWRSTIGIATSVQIPKILEQWVLHLTGHVIAPAGRGSRSGANRHVRWESCEACGLRLSYTPESCMGLTRSDPSSGTTPSGHRGPDQREEAREQEHRAGGQEDRLYHAQQPSLENQLKAVRKKEEWVKLQTAKDAQNKGYPEPKFDDKWTEAENQFLESTDPAALGSDSAPLDHTSNQFCPPMTPEEPAAYKKQLEEEMTQAPGRKARKAEESAENLEYSQRTYSRPGRMDT